MLIFLNLSVFLFSSFQSFGFTKLVPSKESKSIGSVVEGTVLRCHDGDTCHIKVGGKKIKVRFSGIDTPELKQKYGKDSKRFVEGLIKGKSVHLSCDGKSYDRKTCTVFLGSMDVNAEIVKNGWAFEVKRYSRGRYTKELKEAQRLGLGIWKDKNITSPYCFRKPQDKQCKKNLAFTN